MIQEFPTIQETLLLIAKGGIVGAALAFAFERFGFFQKLTPNARFWFVAIVTVLSPVVAQALLQFVPPDVWVAIDPFWNSFLLGLTVWSASQVTHILHKRIERPPDDQLTGIVVLEQTTTEPDGQ